MIASAYLALTKPDKLYRLAASAGLGAFAALPFSAPAWRPLLFALFGGVVAAAGANALNMYLERDIDRLCERTRMRPLANGAARPMPALMVALSLVLAGAFVASTFANFVTGMLILSAVVVYAGPYTMWLKRTTPYYTLVGGAIWAAPILVAWTAVGKSLSTAPLALFVSAACWTVLHAWSVGLRDAGERCANGVPFMPARWGPGVTRRHLLLMAVVLSAITAALRLLIVLPFGLALTAVSAVALVDASPRADRLLAGSSIFYICAFAGNLVIGALPLRF